MAQTPYMETEALLAVMSEDEDGALRILDEMLPGERQALVDHLHRLSLLADDAQRCPACGKVVDPSASGRQVYVGVGRSAQGWHGDCLDAPSTVSRHGIADPEPRVGDHR